VYRLLQASSQSAPLEFYRWMCFTTLAERVCLSVCVCEWEGVWLSVCVCVSVCLCACGLCVLCLSHMIITGRRSRGGSCNAGGQG
jgi:hypothetical protein